MANIVILDTDPTSVPTPSTGKTAIGVNSSSQLFTKDDAGNVVVVGSGAGSVTSVGITGNDGIAVSGSPVTTSGNITLDLGDITPTSVAATGNVSGSNLSGTNTGDQTISLTGDVTGSGTGSFAATLSATGVTAGTYKSLTVDSKGRVTNGSNPTTLGGYGITDAINTSEKGAVNGVATLDAGGLVPTSQLPALAVTDVFTVASEAAMLALAAQQGDFAVRTDLDVTFILAAAPASTLGNWIQLTVGPTGTVTSVDVSGGTTGLTTSGGPITSSGTVTLGGTLAVANGGTGQTSFAAGYLTSDGTALSSTDRVDAVTISEKVKNDSGVTLLKGTPVYQIGSVGTNITVGAARADDVTKLAIGVLHEDLDDEEEGLMIVLGDIRGVNTSTFAVGDEIYLGATGGYTNVKPTTGAIQFLGIVTRVSATVGSGYIVGTLTPDQVKVQSGIVSIWNGTAWVEVAPTTLTGDVTGSGTGSFSTTIANNAVSNAKLAQVTSGTIKGRSSASTGNVEDLSGSQTTALLDTFSDTLKGLAPASGGGTTNFLRADGTWSAPAGGGGSSSNTYKEAVRVATTANGVLTTAFENGDTIDDVVLATGDRILIKNQTTASQNGIYIVQASGSPLRATDFDTTGAEVANGAIIPVQLGTVNGGSVWQLVQNGGTIGNNFKFAPVNGIATHGQATWTTPLASGLGSIAIGSNAQATGNGGLGIGPGARANGQSSLVIASNGFAGGTATATGDKAILLVTGSSGAVASNTSNITLRANSSGAVTYNGTNAVTIISGSSDASTLTGNNTININAYQGGSQTFDNSVLLSAIGRAGGSGFGGFSTSANNTVIVSGSSNTGADWPSITNNVCIGNKVYMGGQSAITGLCAINGYIGIDKAGTYFVNSTALTTNATPIEAFTNAPTNTSRITVPTNGCYGFKHLMTARQSGGTAGTAGDCAVFEIKGLIKRGATAATTIVVGSVTTLIAADTAAAGWQVTAAADTTNGALRFTVTGEANKNISWFGKTEFTRIEA